MIVDQTTVQNLTTNVVTHTAIETLNVGTGTGTDVFTMNALGGAAVTDLGTVNVDGGDGDDIFHVTISRVVDVNIGGNLPHVVGTTVPMPGDTLNVTLDNVDPPIVFPASTDGTFTSSGPMGTNIPLDWTSIENVHL